MVKSIYESIRPRRPVNAKSRNHLEQFERLRKWSSFTTSSDNVIHFYGSVSIGRIVQWRAETTKAHFKELWRCLEERRATNCPGATRLWMQYFFKIALWPAARARPRREIHASLQW
jgi:hypothetical protein